MQMLPLPFSNPYRYPDLPCIAELKGKYDNTFYYCETEEDIQNMSLDILWTRYHSRRFYYEPKKPEQPEVSKEEMGKMKEGSIRTAIEEEWERYEQDCKRYPMYKKNYDRIIEALRKNDGHMAFVALKNRNDWQYEEIEFHSPAKIKKPPAGDLVKKKLSGSRISNMRIQLSQVNPTVGALKSNTAMMHSEILFAAGNKCDVVVFPELVTTGYPPQDLLYSDYIWSDHDIIVQNTLEFVKSLKYHITVIFGGLNVHNGAKYNAAYIIDKTHGVRVYRKKLLPSYDVFYENRYFAASDEPVENMKIVYDNGKAFSYCHVLICEDIWNQKEYADSSLMPYSYKDNPVSEVINDFAKGPIFVINASPFWQKKFDTTMSLVSDISYKTKRIVCWVNQVGGHDDIVFGGYSMVVEPNGFIRCGKMFTEDRIVVNANFDSNVPQTNSNDKSNKMLWIDPEEDLPEIRINDIVLDRDDFESYMYFSAMKLALVDYLRRCGFSKACIGLSGGIDSAVVAAVAALSLGRESVTGLLMPSMFSSKSSITDAEELAKNLGISWRIVSISNIHEQFRNAYFGQNKARKSVTDENIQARIRGSLLMMESNDNDSILITTGNKSEISVGYCTLYGDSNGGYGIIGDIYKTEVFRIARFINKYFGNVIPVNSIEKPPSAELRDNQKDSDSLPPYDILDPILISLIEQGKHADEVYAETGNKEVYRVAKMIDTNEWKRKQMTYCVKLRKRSFGSGRKMPVAKKVQRA